MKSEYVMDFRGDDSGDLGDEYASQILSFSPSPIPSQLGSSKGNSRKRTKNFTSQEDLMLVAAWLNVSKDPVSGNDKKSQPYWERLYAYYHKNKQFTSDRNANSLMHRWSAIQLAVGKFQNYFNEIEARNKSGVSIQDKICLALEMYKSLQKCSFQFIHCWHELRDAPKFCCKSSKKTLKTSQSTLKTSQSTSLASSSPSTPDLIDLDDTNGVCDEAIPEQPKEREAEKECARMEEPKEVDKDDMRQLMLEIKESQQIQAKESKETLAELLRMQKDKEERVKRKEEREILAIDTSNMDEFAAEYYLSLKIAIIEKRRKTGFNL